MTYMSVKLIQLYEINLNHLNSDQKLLIPISNNMDI